MVIEIPGPPLPDIDKVCELQRVFRYVRDMVDEVLKQAWRVCRDSNTLSCTGLDSDTLIVVFCASQMDPKYYVAKHYAERRRQKDPLINYLLNRIGQAGNKLIDLSGDESKIHIMAYHLCTWAELAEELVRLYSNGWSSGEGTLTR